MDKGKSSHPDKKLGNAVKSADYGFFHQKPGQIRDINISLESSFFSMLQDFSKEKKMFFSLPKQYLDYKPPKLHRGKTSWYISYYVKHPETGRLRLFRVKVNHIKPVRERIQAAKEIMAGLQERLALGWNPLLERVAPRASSPAFQVFDTYIRVKEKEMEAQSMHTYRSYVRVFRQWLQGAGFTDQTLICSINETVARRFMAFLEEDKGVAPRTYNGYLSFLVTFFDWMRDKGYVQDNVFQKIQRKPKRLMKKKRRMLTDAELGKLYAFLDESNPEYLAVCLLCYCCFMRPKEIALLKCRDIDVRKQLVHVRPEIAKNDNESFRTIPDAMMPVIRRLDLSNPGMFLFGAHPGEGGNFTPGWKPTAKKKFSDYWASTVRDACGFPMDVQFYSQKDTGITNMLGEGTAINLVQQQADHSSVAMTALYVGHTATAADELKKSSILKIESK